MFHTPFQCPILHSATVVPNSYIDAFTNSGVAVVGILIRNPTGCTNFSNLFLR